MRVPTRHHPVNIKASCTSPGGHGHRPYGSHGSHGSHAATRTSSVRHRSCAYLHIIHAQVAHIHVYHIHVQAHYVSKSIIVRSACSHRNNVCSHHFGIHMVFTATQSHFMPQSWWQKPTMILLGRLLADLLSNSPIKPSSHINTLW